MADFINGGNQTDLELAIPCSPNTANRKLSLKKSTFQSAVAPLKIDPEVMPLSSQIFALENFG